MIVFFRVYRTSVFLWKDPRPIFCNCATYQSQPCSSWSSSVFPTCCNHWNPFIRSNLSAKRHVEKGASIAIYQTDHRSRWIIHARLRRDPTTSWSVRINELFFSFFFFFSLSSFFFFFSPRVRLGSHNDNDP